MQTNTRPRAHPLSLAVLLTLTLTAACGNNRSADPPATSAPVPNTPPATILSPGTTPATTTTPPTTTLAPSPVPAADDSEQAVIDATQVAWAAFNEAVLDPEDDNKRNALESHFTGDVLAEALEIVDTYRTDGQREVTSDIVPTRIDVISGSIEVDEATRSAQLETCRLGSNVRVEAATTPGDSDRVLDDTVNAHRERTTLKLINGAWLVSYNTVLSTFPGALECEA